jgi:hypothetical protein
MKKRKKIRLLLLSVADISAIYQSWKTSEYRICAFAIIGEHAFFGRN